MVLLVLALLSGWLLLIVLVLPGQVARFNVRAHRLLLRRILGALPETRVLTT